MSQRYKKSEELLDKALKSIPLGTQTFSKSKTQYPFGVSPYFIQKGLGSKVWDVDGNEYIDFVNALGAITLGYCDTDINNAVKAQLEEGTIFSLPHPIEVSTAEKFIEMIPCAEMVRFGKNGSDATAGAIRAVRAFKKKDHVAVCGYHGWQDWYIGSTARNLGVPQATQELTHKFMYNNIESLHKIFREYPDRIACVIMEAMNVEYPKEGFLQEVKELTHKNGALFVIDEMVTGFKYSNGGAQEYFGVTPDLATFGKGMANGYPISVVAGKADIMKVMEEVFFSFTFGGETLSLAAAYTCMNKYQTFPVIETMAKQGEKIIKGLKNIIETNSLENVFSVSGHPCWSFFLINDFNGYSSWQIKTLYVQEMLKRGILILGTHNLSYSHSDEDIQKLLFAYKEVISLIKEAVNTKKLEKHLKCSPLEPLFKIR